MAHSVKRIIGGKELVIETGKMARQAGGACTVRYGDTLVLCTATASSQTREGVNFFPLTVDYREKTSAAGMFPGGYIKREGRPTEKEILTMRLIDRPLRPLFADGLRCEVQVVGSVLSADDEHDPDVLSVVGGATACLLSDMPFTTPVGCVRIGRVEGEWLINPTYSQLSGSDCDIVVAGTPEAIIMVEGSAREVSEGEMIEALACAHEAIKEITSLQKELREVAGKETMTFEESEPDVALEKAVVDFCAGKLDEAIMTSGKKNREGALENLCRMMCEEISRALPGVDEAELKSLFARTEKKRVRELILEKGIRADGRGPDEIRPIQCEVGILPRTHGSALFTRGETQALVVATLGTVSDQQRLEAYEGESAKSFMLHYNFPPFSVGEVRPMRGPKRREIGHGSLAERALAGVMPEEEYAYTVRLVSDILESNGSSSMASVCGGSLALMDAGVPVSRAVAGIAMGLVIGDGRTVVLTDILGSEDACGDMDFKVAGTSEGITAFQLDSKVEGIPAEILTEALEKARIARQAVLEKMNGVIPQPRAHISPYAPQIVRITIDPEKIGDLIGPKGKNIKKICQETGAEIDVDDDGNVSVASSNAEDLKRAVEDVRRYTEDVEIGKVYRGIVKSVVDFGAFLEILPGKEGLLHISKMADYRVGKVTDIMDEGDEVMVKVTNIDSRGRIDLNRKDALHDHSGERRNKSPRGRRFHVHMRGDRENKRGRKEHS